MAYPIRMCKGEIFGPLHKISYGFFIKFNLIWKLVLFPFGFLSLLLASELLELQSLKRGFHCGSEVVMKILMQWQSYLFIIYGIEVKKGSTQICSL